MTAGLWPCGATGSLAGVVDWNIRLGQVGRAFPVWADWNDRSAERYTLGVEEELMLLHPDRWSLAQSSDRVVAGLSDEVAGHVAPETHAAVVELITGVHADVDGLAGELADLRARLGQEL